MKVMAKVKITSDKIEEIFLFMNFFKPNELFNHEYLLIKENAFPHTLYVTLGAITDRKFWSALKKFNNLHQNLLTAEVLENSKSHYSHENYTWEEAHDTMPFIKEN